MKIAHVVCTFPPYKGGMGNSAFYFAKSLFTSGHDITVFTPDYGKDVGRENSFEIVRLRPLFKMGNAALLPQLLWRLKNFDIIHIHYPFYGFHIIAIFIKLLFGKKVKMVLHYHMDPSVRGIKGLFFYFNRIFIAPILFRMVDIITCASLDYVRYSSLGKYYEKNKNKFREILFGVDLERFRQGDREIDDKIILFVGGLDKAHYFKGVDVLLKAASKLDIDWRLKIIGGGELQVKYEKLAQKLGIAERVDFMGSVRTYKLPIFYNNCDVLVLPSINQGEAFGLVLLEAMASAKPVIASRLPGVREVFEDGTHGFLVNIGDPEDLAEKLEIILRDDGLAQRMGQAGRKLVEEKYTWEKVAERLIKIYEDLLNK